jgi:hypothetical protein
LVQRRHGLDVDLGIWILIGKFANGRMDHGVQNCRSADDLLNMLAALGLGFDRLRETQQVDRHRIELFAHLRGHYRSRGAME